MSWLARRPLVRWLLSTAILVAVYFIVPTDRGSGVWELVARVLFSLVGIVVVAVLIVRQINRHLGDDETPLLGLLNALTAGVLFFALADYVVAVGAPGSFVDLQTRVDALYFALSTLITVGFGDVHAQGQQARVLLILQMVFNTVVIAAGVSVLSHQLAARARERHRGK
ncbi:potassium channel family protein [Catellatospora sp. KI3]|uniref:potassium channel family protein n=1 Tax=Catellatospora sp. KI3 TaxID=3041620 RepID=UPI0024824D76|nr:potassium channel family protein [Catellatospora sp. KI3]MDI1462802.1 potassium channel family protein [Catellatospora sp. KI3]